MGKSKRVTPERLGEKLKTIREKLGMTTTEIVDELRHPTATPHRASITQYEKGRREPPLITLLQYARLYNVGVETLIDDEMNLPD